MNLTVRARGLTEVRKALKQLDSELGKELRQVWLKAARLLEARTAGAAPPRARGAIKARATQRAAFLRLTARRGDELAVFMGQKQRSGWYSHPRYADSAGRQHEPWVGNQWDPGEASGKPYFIGDAINNAADEVVDLVADEVELLVARAIGR